MVGGAFEGEEGTFELVREVMEFLRLQLLSDLGEGIHDLGEALVRDLVDETSQRLCRPLRGFLLFVCVVITIGVEVDLSLRRDLRRLVDV